MITKESLLYKLCYKSYQRRGENYDPSIHITVYIHSNSYNLGNSKPCNMVKKKEKELISFIWWEYCFKQMFIQPIICNMARVETLHNLARYANKGGI